MPFKSRKQMRYLFAKEPDMALRWAHKYGTKPRKKLKRRKKT